MAVELIGGIAELDDPGPYGTLKLFGCLLGPMILAAILGITLAFALRCPDGFLTFIFRCTAG